MRQLIIFFTILVCSALTTKAQTLAQNNSGCPVEVWRICYDANTCDYVGESLETTLYAGDQVSVPDCGSGQVTGFFVKSLNGWPCGAHPGGLIVGDPNGNCGGLLVSQYPFNLMNDPCCGPINVAYSPGNLNIY